MKATLTEIKRTDREVWHEVRENGRLLGFITKYTDDATTTHPWKAFLPKFVARSRPQFGEMVAVFYGKRAQADAIECLAELPS